MLAGTCPFWIASTIENAPILAGADIKASRTTLGSWS